MWNWKQPRLSSPLLVAVALVALATTSQAAPRGGNKGNPGGSHGGGSNSGWQDDFTGSKLNTHFWMVGGWWAPGYIANDHQGYYDADNVSLQGGNLILHLWQEHGTVDSNTDGILSHGALVASKKKYGYGTYEWRMRMSSTATTPTGAGQAISGSVSAGFLYVNNSETEIDFEFSARNPGTLYMVNWYNTNPSTGPFGSQETYTNIPLSDVSDTFHTYKFVWEPGKITYYVDGVLRATHTENVPSTPAYFMINHWGTDSSGWGGTATVGVDRYFYIDWVRYTPLP